MKVKHLVLIVAAALVFSGLAFSQDMVEKVGDRAFGQRMRPPVSFYHEDHNEKAEIDDCAACHHYFDEEGNLLEDETSEDQACSDCHGKTNSDVPVELANRYHKLCKGCHLEQKNGPIQCGECHSKSS